MVMGTPSGGYNKVVDARNSDLTQVCWKYGCHESAQDTKGVVSLARVEEMLL